MKRTVRRWAYAAFCDGACAIFDLAAWITKLKETP